MQLTGWGGDPNPINHRKLLTHHYEGNGRRLYRTQGLEVAGPARVVLHLLTQSVVFDGLQGEHGAADLNRLLVVVPAEGGFWAGDGRAGQVEVGVRSDELGGFMMGKDQDLVRSVCGDKDAA